MMGLSGFSCGCEAANAGVPTQALRPLPLRPRLCAESEHRHQETHVRPSVYCCLGLDTAQLPGVESVGMHQPATLTCSMDESRAMHEDHGCMPQACLCSASGP